MSQISLATSQKPNTIGSLVGVEAENPIPTKKSKLASMDVVGLSWIFLDDPFDITNYK